MAAIPGPMVDIETMGIEDIGIYELGAGGWCWPEVMSAHVGCGLTEDEGDDIIGCWLLCDCPFCWEIGWTWGVGVSAGCWASGVDCWEGCVGDVTGVWPWFPTGVFPGPGCFIIFLYFERLFWNQILTWKKNKTFVYTVVMCQSFMKIVNTQFERYDWLIINYRYIPTDIRNNHWTYSNFY